MYFSKECQSKCIRNTVSSLLVLARDVHTSVPCDRILGSPARRVDPCHRSARSAARFQVGQSTRPSSFTNPACPLGCTTSSKWSPFHSLAPAAIKEVFPSLGMSQSCWLRWWRLPVQGWLPYLQSTESKRRGVDQGRSGGCKGGSRPFGFSFGEVSCVVSCAVLSQRSVSVFRRAEPYSRARRCWGYPCTSLHFSASLTWVIRHLIVGTQKYLPSNGKKNLSDKNMDGLSFTQPTHSFFAHRENTEW